MAKLWRSLAESTFHALGWFGDRRERREPSPAGRWGLCKSGSALFSVLYFLLTLLPPRFKPPPTAATRLMNRSRGTERPRDLLRTPSCRSSQNVPSEIVRKGTE